MLRHNLQPRVRCPQTRQPDPAGYNSPIAPRADETVQNACFPLPARRSKGCCHRLHHVPPCRNLVNTPDSLITIHKSPHAPLRPSRTPVSRCLLVDLRGRRRCFHHTPPCATARAAIFNKSCAHRRSHQPGTPEHEWAKTVAALAYR